MKKIKKDLQEVSKSLKALARKTEKLLKGVDKLGKAQQPALGGKPSQKIPRRLEQHKGLLQREKVPPRKPQG
ncbi:MAG: hypothetical protein SV375_19590 [Thermodesulfobacteriota bacterium]|nr:hypothetical protein [Thermodesulfobacteriota bacterium]